MTIQEGDGALEEKTVEFIEVTGKDGKVERFDKEKIENVLKFRAEATQKTQKVAKVLDAINRYQVDEDTFLSNAEAAMELAANLMEKGIIDDQGNPLVEGRQKASEKPREREEEPYRPAQRPTGSDDINALKAQLEGLQGVISTMQKDNATLIKSRLADDISKKYPQFTDKDVNEVLNRSFRDRSMKYMEHAEKVSQERLNDLSSLEKAFADKYGVNLDEYNRKKQQSAEGGVAAMFKGKKVTSTPKGPNDVHLRDAVAALFESKGEL